MAENSKLVLSLQHSPRSNLLDKNKNNIYMNLRKSLREIWQYIPAQKGWELNINWKVHE